MAEREEIFPSLNTGAMSGDVGYDPSKDPIIQDRYETRNIGEDFTPSEDTYINNAWKHMIQQDRVSVTGRPGHMETNDKGSYYVEDSGFGLNRPEREQAERWDRFVDSADTYMEAASSNRTALGKGNQLLIGEALEDEKNSPGGRSGSAIREVRTA